MEAVPFPMWVNGSIVCSALSRIAGGILAARGPSPAYPRSLCGARREPHSQECNVRRRKSAMCAVYGPAGSRGAGGI